MNVSSSTRRQFLTATTAALGASLLANASGQPASAPAPATKRKRTLRIAHLTDTHTTPPKKNLQDSVAGLTAALRHVHAQPDRPDLILFGGDLVWDSLKTEKDAVLEQWALWQRIVSAEVTIPWRTCLGNHDVWGWALHRPEASRDPAFGKRLALDLLGMKDRYYSFDQGGWHIVVLDSMQIDNVISGGYTARLDDEQMLWLAADLAAQPANHPVLILSHIPILTTSVFMGDDVTKNGAFFMGGGVMHTDVKVLKGLFHQHRNVKACLSGHIHLVDEVSYLGVRYFCNGAVSGSWWKGPHQEFPPGYALVDLHDDGTVENTMVYY